MNEEIFAMTPNPERAKSILTQIEVRKDAMKRFLPQKHATLLVEAYYEIIKELLTALLAIDGYKTLSHTALIDYLKEKYNKEFTEIEVYTIDEFRKIRNKISYEGHIVSQEYYERKKDIAERLMQKLQTRIEGKLK